MKALAAAGEKGLVEIMAATHAGMTTEEFSQAGARLDRHAHAIRASTGPTPSSSTSRCSSCSPICAPTASRPSSSRAAASSSCAPWAERVYGIPPEQVVGSSGVVKFEMGADGKPVLVKEPKVEFIDDGPGKPVGINRFIGRRPILAFGNSDGDQQMLQWTAAGDGPRFVGIVHHTDAEREWAYDRAIAHRQARQGARRGDRQGLDRRRHEARLEEGVRIRGSAAPQRDCQRRQTMKKTILASLACSAWLASATRAESLRGRPQPPHDRAARGRGGDLGHAGGQHRPDAPADAHQDQPARSARSSTGAGRSTRRTRR